MPFDFLPNKDCCFRSLLALCAKVQKNNDMNPNLKGK